MNSGGLNVIQFLDTMAAESRFGFKAFSETKPNDTNVRGIVYDDLSGESRPFHETVYRIVSEYNVIGNKPVITATLDDVFGKYGLLIDAVEGSNGEMWLKLSSNDSSLMYVIVKDGRWFVDL